MKKRVLLILADGFEEIEAVAVADVLRRLDVEVCLAGLNELTVRGAHDMKITADALLTEVDAALFDAVYLPGGLPGATNLLESELTGRILKETAARGGIVSAICAAPIVLAKHGLLDGRIFTMYPGFEAYLNGLVPTGKPAEHNGNVITGKGPGAVFDFAAQLAAALGVDTAALYDGMFVRI